jgi:hypothetical protein
MWRWRFKAVFRKRFCQDKVLEFVGPESRSFRWILNGIDVMTQKRLPIIDLGN